MKGSHRLYIVIHPKIRGKWNWKVSFCPNIFWNSCIQGVLKKFTKMCMMKEVHMNFSFFSVQRWAFSFRFQSLFGNVLMGREVDRAPDGIQFPDTHSALDWPKTEGGNTPPGSPGNVRKHWSHHSCILPWKEAVPGAGAWDQTPTLQCEMWASQLQSDWLYISTASGSGTRTSWIPSILLSLAINSSFKHVINI